MWLKEELGKKKTNERSNDDHPNKKRIDWIKKGDSKEQREMIKCSDGRGW